MIDCIYWEEFTGKQYAKCYKCGKQAKYLFEFKFDNSYPILKSADGATTFYFCETHKKEIFKFFRTKDTKSFISFLEER